MVLDYTWLLEQEVVRLFRDCSSLGLRSHPVSVFQRQGNSLIEGLTINM